MGSDTVFLLSHESYISVFDHGLLGGVAVFVPVVWGGEEEEGVPFRVPLEYLKVWAGIESIMGSFLFYFKLYYFSVLGL